MINLILGLTAIMIILVNIVLVDMIIDQIKDRRELAEIDKELNAAIERLKARLEEDRRLP